MCNSRAQREAVQIPVFGLQRYDSGSELQKGGLVDFYQLKNRSEAVGGGGVTHVRLNGFSPRAIPLETET